MALNIIVPVNLASRGCGVREYLLRNQGIDVSDLLNYTLDLWYTIAHEDSMELHQQIADRFYERFKGDRRSFKDYCTLVSILTRAVSTTYSDLLDYLGPVLEGYFEHETPRLQLVNLLGTDAVIEAMLRRDHHETTQHTTGDHPAHG
jgi:hypothetical protein